MSLLPKGWRRTEIGSIARVIRGSSPRPKGDPRYYGGSVPRLMVADVTRDGKYVTPQIDYLTEEGAKLSRPVPAGTLTVVCSGDIGVPSILAVDACIHDGFLGLMDISSEVDKEFLYQALLPLKQAFHRSATHGGVFVNLTTDILAELPLNIPPAPEQRAISEVLGKWDQSIEKLTRLIALKEERKRGLMQRLFNRKKQLNQNRGDKWQTVYLGDVASESSLRNQGKLNRESLMAVTKAEGMVPMRERVQGESFERCKIVKVGWFAYNPMRINIGSIARWKKDHDAMVSGDYVVFHCNQDELDPCWLEQFQQTHRWKSFVQNAGNGSVRVRIWFSDLARLQFRLPPIEEQRRAVQVLQACDREIELLEKQMEAFKEQKRGLMQKLLTGEIRIKVPNKK